MRFGWIAIGSENTGSTRHFVLNCHNQLLLQNIYSEILSLNSSYYPDILNDVDEIKNKIINNKLTHVVFQKVIGEKAKDIVLFCKKNNITTIYNNGDWYYDDFYKEFDLILVGSTFIRDKLKNEFNLPQVEVMYDMLEHTTPKTKEHRDTEFPTLGWFGNKGKIPEITSFLHELNVPNECVLISNTVHNDSIRATIEMGDGTGTPWDIERLYNIFLDKVDILIIPIEINEENKNIQYAKTANRLLPGIQLKIPILYTPIPSYNEIIISKDYGLSCTSLQEWRDSINFLKNKENREFMGNNANRLLNKFTPLFVINYFKDVVKKHTKN